MSTAVCRVCIVGDVKMHKIEIDLQEIYEKLTGSKLSMDDGMPKTVCYICYSQLQKCKKFSETALQSEKLLKHQLNHGNVEHHSVRTCPLLHLRVVENLSVTVSQSVFKDSYTNSERIQENKHKNNYICINETNSISVKIEVDVKKETLADEAEDLVKSERMLITDYEDALSNTESHKDSDTANTNDTWHYCDVCNKKFATKSQMRTHLRTHKEKSLSCSTCGKSFFMIHNFRKHIKTCSTNRSSSAHICSSCHESFSNITNLKRHMKTHSEERPFICDRCSNKFKTRTHLKVHMRIHGGEKPFACDVCGKAFTQISNLKTHMKIHEGTKPFACEICGKAFLTNGTLKSHMRCHTGERPFSCNTCGMTFGFKCSLNQHIRRLHTEVKAYPCSRCHMSFNQEVGLTAHMRAHTAERAYPCDKCSKAFTSARNLKGHNMQVHSGERPHGCAKCGKAYKRPEHLRQHLKSFKCKAQSLSQTAK